jgi:hypothetical protein
MFDTNANNRSNQDVGLDGLSDANEGRYTNFASETDPAADDYSFEYSWDYIGAV